MFSYYCSSGGYNSWEMNIFGNSCQIIMSDVATGITTDQTEATGALIGQVLNSDLANDSTVGQSPAAALWV